MEVKGDFLKLKKMEVAIITSKKSYRGIFKDLTDDCKFIRLFGKRTYNKLIDLAIVFRPKKEYRIAIKEITSVIILDKYGKTDPCPSLIDKEIENACERFFGKK